MAEEKSAGSIHMYLREITDLRQYLEEPSATKYVDLKQNAIDQEAQVASWLLIWIIYSRLMYMTRALGVPMFSVKFIILIKCLV